MPGVVVYFPVGLECCEVFGSRGLWRRLSAELAACQCRSPCFFLAAYRRGEVCSGGLPPGGLGWPGTGFGFVCSPGDPTRDPQPPQPR